MWQLIISTQIIIYLLIHIFNPNIFDGFIGTYVIRPLLFLFLIIEIIIISNYEGIKIWRFNKARRLEIARNPLEAALLFGGFQVSLLVIAGLFFGFGKSPYSHTPLFLLINFIFVFSALFGFELARSYLIKKGISNTRNLTLIIISITFFFLILSIQPNKFLLLDFSNPIASVKFIGETILPLITMNLLACYLAYIGGATAAIGYLGIIKAFEWFSPILPNLEWQITAFIGILAPTIGFLLIQNSIKFRNKNHERKHNRRRQKEPVISWTVVASFCVVIVLFSTGVFGIQPSVIYSGSMRPTLDIGDITLITKINPEDVEINDIIQFPMENISIPIIHRVIDIYEENNNIYYITKGDDNSNPDSEPVNEKNLRGKVIYTIPEIGWISIIIKNMLQNIGIKI